MTPEEKYKKLRAAAVAMIGVEDDKGILLAMLSELHSMSAQDDEDGSAALGLLVALIETGKDDE